MRKLLAFAAFVSFASFGCAAETASAPDDESDVEESEGAASLASTSTFYTARIDVRRCMSPFCGGYWVKRVNRATTRCADGSYASECYVAEIDFAKAGLEGSDLFGRSLVLRGAIVTKDYGVAKLGKLEPTEVWADGVKGAAASGSFYRLGDNGVRCVTSPCFTIDADKLNSTVSRRLSSLDGTHGLLAGEALAAGKILAAGTVHATKNGGRALAVTQFWTRVEPAPADPLACKVDSDCTTSVYNKTVKSSGDCYCTTCPTTIMSTAAETAYRKSWETHCSSIKMSCPAVACAKPPEVACVAGKCQPKSESCDVPSVPKSDPRYARYEAPSAKNACTSDSDCMTSGCSGEVCAAESLFTTCEAIPKPAGTCGCVAGECQWHTTGTCG